MTNIPGFLIIGAQKAGTSWLHEKLRLHPAIQLPPVKDQAFFCWDGGPYATSFEQYCQGLGSKTGAQVTGEATAAYFWTDSGSRWDIKPDHYCVDIPKRVLETLGADTRLVLSLRDPVDRAVSAYLHHIANGDLDAGTGLLEAGEFGGLIDIGFYAVHLHNWLRYFPIEQIEILIYERDVVRNQRATLNRVFSFLGVDPDWRIDNPEKIVFLGRQRVWCEDEVWIPLSEYPTASPSKQQQIGGHSYWRCVDRSTTRNLRGIYAQDRMQLQSMLGIDLDGLWS